jgi:ubiquinone/menaquinone biosynthesis C-methylase UbiE
MDRNLIGRTGFDATTYASRQNGYSPAPIRDAVWQLVGGDVSGTVLDAGSGEGGWIKHLQQSQRIRRIISIDLVNVGAQELDGVEFHLGDLSESRLPCGENEIDWIFALEVLEHLTNPRHFAAESYRCLKKGAKLVVTTPCNDSLTAKLSFLFRGYFPSFSDHDYKYSGHITAITELDLCRIAQEAGFQEIQFSYPLPGRIPKTAIPWQRALPFLRGKLWCDCLFAVLTK